MLGEEYLDENSIEKKLEVFRHVVAVKIPVTIQSRILGKYYRDVMYKCGLEISELYDTGKIARRIPLLMDINVTREWDEYDVHQFLLLEWMKMETVWNCHGKIIIEGLSLPKKMRELDNTRVCWLVIEKENRTFYKNLIGLYTMCIQFKGSRVCYQLL